MACINLCPKQAIEYGKRTEGKPRYTGPELL
jgi:NAD-dependent dihydropyrimidine dehydrogenase PreA subunit